MIERVLDQETAISQVLKADKKTRHLVPLWQDLDVMVLGPLRDFIDALSGEDYVSVSYVKPVLHLLRVDLLNLSDDDSELTNTIKTTILNYLTKKYQDPTTDALLDMASLVDLRFKTQYIDSDKKEGVQARAVSELEALLNVQAQHPLQSTSQSPETEEQTPPKKAKKKTLASFLKISGAVSAAGTSASLSSLREAIDGEIKAHLSTPMQTVRWILLNGGNSMRETFHELAN